VPIDCHLVSAQGPAAINRCTPKSFITIARPSAGWNKENEGRMKQQPEGRIRFCAHRKTVRSAAAVEIVIKHHPDWFPRLIANFINFILKRQGLGRSAGIVSDCPPSPKSVRKSFLCKSQQEGYTVIIFKKEQRLLSKFLV
jgi:hypothetical protein